MKFTAPPERRATTPKPCSPSYFIDYLSRRWAEGCVRGRELLHEIKLRGYTGSFSHLERPLAKWRRANDAKVVTLPPVPEPMTAPTTTICDGAPHRRSRDWVDDLAKTFRNSASGSMTHNNLASTLCNASLERCGEISTPSQTSLTEGWSNGQTEGQINRLKTLKRAMYGRAGVELLRARMLPLHLPMQHGE